MEVLWDVIRTMLGVATGITGIGFAIMTVRTLREPRCWYTDESGHKRYTGYIPRHDSP